MQLEPVPDQTLVVWAGGEMFTIALYDVIGKLWMGEVISQRRGHLVTAAYHTLEETRGALLGIVRAEVAEAAGDWLTAEAERAQARPHAVWRTW